MEWDSIALKASKMVHIRQEQPRTAVGSHGAIKFKCYYLDHLRLDTIDSDLVVRI